MFLLELSKKLIARRRRQCEPVSDDGFIGTYEWNDLRHAAHGDTDIN